MSEESAWERPPDFKGDSEKVAEQPVPSSSIEVVGTTWSEVKCLDGRVYYYNSESEVGRGFGHKQLCIGVKTPSNLLLSTCGAKPHTC